MMTTCARMTIAALAISATCQFAHAQTAGATNPPSIVDRAAWKAKAAKEGLMKRQTPREIIVHHTSVRQQRKLSLEKKLQGLQSFSMKEGTVGTRRKPAWGDVPYHYYIDVTGRIGEGRRLNFAGDTNTKYNTAHRIQIVVEGEFEKETPDKRQIAALSSLIVWLADKHKIPAAKITGHNDHASTDCPGRNLKSYLPALRAQVKPAG